MKISIVTPSYNQAQFLEKTVTSVLNQNYPDIEYFVMDGGSTDDSAQVIRKYEDRLSGWVSEKDRGQADGINKGLARVSGDIVAWINSDDFYLPGAFSKVTEFFEANPQIDLVYGDVISVGKNGAMINVMRFQPYKLEDLMTFHIISQPGVFFRRSLLEKSGDLDLSYHFLLDHQLWLRMAANGNIAYLPQPLAAARFHEEAKNRAGFEKFGAEAGRIADWLLSDPLFSRTAPKLDRQIRGGAAWLDAHYLSEGGQAAKSLSAYKKAWDLYPDRVKSDCNRLLLTLLMRLSPGMADRVFSSQSQKRLRNLTEYNRYLSADSEERIGE